MPTFDADAATRTLIQHAQDGEPDSFARVYERLAPSLLAWAKLRIRPAFRGRIEPDDLVQEVFVRAWNRLATFDPERSTFRAWLFTVAKNVLLEGYRTLIREAPRGPSADDQPGLISRIADSATAVSRKVARQDGVRRFLTEVEALEETDRQLVVHVGLEGLTCREAAQRLDLTLASAQKRWQRLRERLEQRTGLAEFLLEI